MEMGFPLKVSLIPATTRHFLLSKIVETMNIVNLRNLRFLFQYIKSECEIVYYYFFQNFYVDLYIFKNFKLTTKIF